LARHLAAVEQRADRRQRLREPVESLAEAAAEIDAERAVLRFEPRAADAEDRPPAADAGANRSADAMRVWIPVRDGESAEGDARR
jgi:hypothetical protein